jgi:hypothetical protein
LLLPFGFTYSLRPNPAILVKYDFTLFEQSELGVWSAFCVSRLYLEMNLRASCVIGAGMIICATTYMRKAEATFSHVVRNNTVRRRNRACSPKALQSIWLFHFDIYRLHAKALFSQTANVLRSLLENTDELDCQ